jgi:phage shock protein PspC (stress-responsive transcriptional regulator)
MANLLTRNDTLLGICQGLGEDFGFNPLWLRIVFATGLLWNPTVMVAGYLGLGVLVLASRLIVRDRPAAVQPSQVTVAAAQEREPEVEALQIAA